MICKLGPTIINNSNTHKHLIIEVSAIDICIHYLNTYGKVCDLLPWEIHNIYSSNFYNQRDNGE